MATTAGFSPMRIWLLLAPVASLLLSGATIARQVGAATTAPVETPCPASGDMRADFASAVTASSLRTRDGREIRLAGVIGPGEDGVPVGSEVIATARSALAAELAGHELRFAAVNLPDRYQRITAQLFADGNWLQQAMLRDGLVRVDPELAAGSCYEPMRSIEQQAMAAMAGHWGDGRFRVKTPDEVTKSAGRFEIVEGEVWRIRNLKGRQIIEFRNASSFEVWIEPQTVRALRLANVDVRRLRGKIIRVRGWIGLDDRAVMAISTPAALQLIQK